MTVHVKQFRSVSGEGSGLKLRSPRTGRAGPTPGRRLANGLGLLTLAVGVIAVAFPLAIRPWYSQWGATSAEATKHLPGDEVVATPVAQVTRAITINAPAETVWPWIVQMGQGRGGLYSYDWLENLLGCDIHSVDRVLPELQNLKVGDVIRMVPEPYVMFGRTVEGGPKFVVESLQPSRALVLRVPQEARDSGFDSTWAFVLEPVDAKTTRLIVRSRSYSQPAWKAPMIGVEPIAFVMEREMLRGIKARAEGMAQARGANSAGIGG